MIGNDFMFGNEWLSEFGLVMCSPEDAQQFVPRTVNRAEISSLRASPNHYGSTYNGALVLNFFVMKEDGMCGRQEDFKLTGDEIHYIRSWLESPKRPTELVVPMQEDEMTVHYFGIFTEVQPYVVEDDCYGFTLAFTCNAPYGYSDEITMRYKINSSSNSVNGQFYNMSAELEEYLKPIVTIFSSNVFGSNEGITIKNVSDNNKETVVSLPAGLSKIIIDCNKKIVMDGNGNLIPMSRIGVQLPFNQQTNLISADMYVFNWLSLIPKENKLTFTPSATNTIDKVEISARYIIKSGGF